MQPAIKKLIIIIGNIPRMHMMLHHKDKKPLPQSPTGMLEMGSHVRFIR